MQSLCLRKGVPRGRGEPYTEDAYYAALAKGFGTLTASKSDSKESTPPAVVLDAANGVGGLKWCLLSERLEGSLGAEVRTRGVPPWERHNV